MVSTGAATMTKPNTVAPCIVADPNMAAAEICRRGWEMKSLNGAPASRDRSQRSLDESGLAVITAGSLEDAARKTVEAIA